jgi:hypothetical protein
MKSILIILLCLPFFVTSQALYLDATATLHVERGSGTGTVLYVDGDLENNGTLEDDGSIEVGGAAALPGSLDFMIGGTASGAGYDPLFAGGEITPTGGTLHVTLAGGFTPSIGDEFTVLDGGGLSGIFATINLPALGSSNYWTTSYEPSNGLLKLGVSSLLPIELLDFQAFAAGENVQLVWKTASEINADRFEAEHSTDGIAFHKIGEAKAAGGVSVERSYTLLHERPAAGLNYYRLRSVDLDGWFGFSKVVSVDLTTEQDLSNLRVYPNPATDFFFLDA